MLLAHKNSLLRRVFIFTVHTYLFYIARWSPPNRTQSVMSFVAHLLSIYYPAILCREIHLLMIGLVDGVCCHLHLLSVVIAHHQSKTRCNSPRTSHTLSIIIISMYYVVVVADRQKNDGFIL